MFSTWRTIKPENSRLLMDLEACSLSVQAVVAKRAPSRVIGGLAGIGKSHLVKKELKNSGFPFIQVGAASFVTLYYTLWKHRNAAVVVFEEQDKTFRSENFVNLIKQWTDVGQGQIISYSSREILKNMEKDEPDPDIPPDRFQCRAGAVWLSNKDYTDPKNIPPLLKPHWDALVSRGINPKFIRSNKQELFEYTMSLALEHDFLRNMQLKLEDANIVFRTFCQEATHLNSVSPRELANLARAAKGLREDGIMSPQRWRKEFTTGFRQINVMNKIKIPIDDDGELFDWVKIQKPCERPAPPRQFERQLPGETVEAPLFRW